MNKVFFENKSVLVMGLGRFGGGADVVSFLCRAGAKVTVTDLSAPERLADSMSRLEELAGVEYRLDSHNRDDFERTDVLVVNPAVKPNNEYVQIARSAGALVTSQIEIFFELCPARIIGITGANGKSTTAALTAHLLRGRYQQPATGHESRVTSHESVWLSGNIGNEPLLTILDEIKGGDLVVLELSSFQIEQLAPTNKVPHVALLTNLTPNHLDRYGTFEAYCRSKEPLFQYQKLDERNPAVSIFNAEDEIGCEWFDRYSRERGRSCMKFSADELSGGIRSRFALPGKANLSNLAAAVCIAGYFGVDEGHISDCLPSFKALPHRLEPVGETEGVRWYNDSKATTPLSAIAALEAFEQPVIIIAGGYDKGISFDELGKRIAQRARAAVLIGQTAEKIAGAIEKKLATKDTERVIKVEVVGSLNDAVDSAGKLAVRGDVVLLSPACASYDMFDNFEQRGQEFAELVRAKQRPL